VSLNKAAPTGGAAVYVTSNHSLLPVSAPVVTVPAGANWAAFSLTAGSAEIGADESALLTAALGGVSRTARVAIGRAPGVLSSLSCLPRAVSPGGRIQCNLEVASSSKPQPLQLATGSDQVKIPAVVAARPNQSSLTFRALVDVGAEQQAVPIMAKLGGSQVQDTVLVLPRARPLLSAPEKQLVRSGTSMVFAVTAADPSDSPLQVAAAALPAGASFDPGSGRFEWTPHASQAGRYVIEFTATNSTGQSSSAKTTIEVGAGAPELTPSQALACSPNAIASLEGNWLATREAALWEPSGGTLALGGVDVKINDQAVPVLYSSATEVDFLCPALEAGSPLLLVVETPEGQTAPLSGTMNGASPAILPFDRRQHSQEALSFAEGRDLVAERDFRMVGHPAQPGDEVVIWVTGLGEGGANTAALLVKIGEAYATPDSVEPVAGRAGLYAIHVPVPAAATFGDAVPVALEVTSDGRLLTSNVATAAIEPIRP